VVARWVSESGVRPAYGIRHDARPVPDDFAALAPTMFTSRLCVHYECSPDAIKRWCRQTGVAVPKAPPGRPRPPKAFSAKVVRAAAFRTFRPANAAYQNQQFRDTTLEGRAADHLRKWAPVYRCTERGGVPEDARLLTHWRYGNAILSGAEMIERAKAKGFEPDAWRHLTGKAA
jgi:hypothetical protein